MSTSTLVREDALHTAREWMKTHIVVEGLGIGSPSEQGVRDCMAAGIDACATGGASGRTTTKAAFMNHLQRYWLVKKYPSLVTLARTVAEIERARDEGKVAYFINWQGADPLEDDFHWLEIFHEFGLRILGFCYNEENRLGYGCLEPNDVGLKRFGIDILQDCDRLGILLDCSHTGERTTLDMIDMSKNPCVFTHSNPKSVRDNARNISDTQIRNCTARDGVIGLPVYSDFVADTTEGRQPTLDDWVKCVDYVVDLAGIDHVALGSDITAGPGLDLWWDNNTGRQYRDISGDMTYEIHEIEGIEGSLANIPLLVAALVQRGYREEDVAKLIGGNWLRVYRQVWGS